MNSEHLIQVAFIAFILMQFINALVKPAIEIVNMAIRKEPVAEAIIRLWPLYVTVLIGGSLGWFTEYNLLPAFNPPIIGRVLTAIGIGLGPSFIYDLQDG